MSRLGVALGLGSAFMRSPFPENLAGVFINRQQDPALRRRCPAAILR